MQINNLKKKSKKLIMSLSNENQSLLTVSQNEEDSLSTNEKTTNHCLASEVICKNSIESDQIKKQKSTTNSQSVEISENYIDQMKDNNNELVLETSKNINTDLEEVTIEVLNSDDAIRANLFQNSQDEYSVSISSNQQFENGSNKKLVKDENRNEKQQTNCLSDLSEPITKLNQKETELKSNKITSNLKSNLYRSNSESNELVSINDSCTNSNQPTKSSNESSVNNCKSTLNSSINLNTNSHTFSLTNSTSANKRKIEQLQIVASRKSARIHESQAYHSDNSIYLFETLRKRSSSISSTNSANSDLIR